MARYDHLRLVRLPERLERRKRPGFGGSVERNPKQHSERLRAELDKTIETQRRRRRPAVTPSLILRVRMSGALQEEQWEQVGLTVLSTDPDRTLILFSSSDEMRTFRRRLDAYGAEVPERQKSPSYASFISAIEEVGAVEARDRIGVKLREAGFSGPADFPDDEASVLDVELWDLGDHTLREVRLRQLRVIVESTGDEVLDEYLGPSISILRVRARGALIRELLEIDDIASIDLPPEPDMVTGEALNLTLERLPPFVPVADDVPLIGILDSGVNAHPMIEDILVGAIGVPEGLGHADNWGHGTRVAGIAVFGDLRGQLAEGKLERGARLCAAKVTNDRGGFDDWKIVPKQMREAITGLHHRFGCRIFVHALADPKKPYQGTKASAWAATLDEVARELNVVIVVASGNRRPRHGERCEEAVTDYPRYLTEEENSLFEPAEAMNVVTVGALAHGEGVDSTLAKDPRVRAIARSGEPSPLTRVGPGVRGSTKPDVVDFGGTLVFDAVVQRLRTGEDQPSAGLLTLHHRPTERLFASGSGTSYAAPLVALKACQLLRRFPRASANLIRALMVASAEVPPESIERLRHLGEGAVRSVCGHGQVNLERAAFSSDSRVVLYAEDELALDYFAVYEVPVPEPYQSEKGKRSMRVTLAFDPPVRHSRLDYMGVTMSFRLVRGCDADLVFDHFRKRTTAVEGEVPELASRYQCDLDPGPELRDKGTVQTARIGFQRNIGKYRDPYYLVVRCESGWAACLPEQKQRYAVVVELAHEADIRLYERVRVRVRA